MADVKVNLYGYVRDVAGETNLSLSLPGGGKVSDVLQALIERFGPRFRDRVFTAQGELQGNVKVFVDGAPAEGLEETLSHPGANPSEVSVFIVTSSVGG